MESTPLGYKIIATPHKDESYHFHVTHEGLILDMVDNDGGVVDHRDFNWADIQELLAMKDPHVVIRSAQVYGPYPDYDAAADACDDGVIRKLKRTRRE